MTNFTVETPEKHYYINQVIKVNKISLVTSCGNYVAANGI